MKDEERIRQLMNTDPNDQVGKLTSRQGWAGLWVSERGGGEVVVIQPDGDYELFTYDNEEEMRDAWESFEVSLDIGRPDGHDVIIESCVYGDDSKRDAFHVRSNSDVVCVYTSYSFKKTVWHASTLLKDDARLWLLDPKGDYWLLEPDMSTFEPTD